jgi:hypothetical protein
MFNVMSNQSKAKSLGKYLKSFKRDKPNHEVKVKSPESEASSSEPSNSTSSSCCGNILSSVDKSMSEMAHAIGHLGSAINNLNLSSSSNPESDKVIMRKSFLNAQRLSLHPFDINNTRYWLYLLNQKFDEFEIVDSYQKYQLTIGLFSLEELRKLDAYTAKGTQEQYYDNLVLGIKTIFSPSDVASEFIVKKLMFDGSEFPSSFAATLRFLNTGISDEALKIKLHTKLPRALMLDLAPYIRLPLPSYLEMADNIYSSRKLVCTEPELTKPVVSQNDNVTSSLSLDMSILSKLQDTVSARSEIISQQKHILSKLQNNQSCETTGLVSSGSVQTNFLEEYILSAISR